jgi:hypothetical protein
LSGYLNREIVKSYVLNFALKAGTIVDWLFNGAVSIVTILRVYALLIDGYWIGFIDTLYTQLSTPVLQVIQRYRYSAHFTVHRYTSTSVLSLH